MEDATQARTRREAHQEWIDALRSGSFRQVQQRLGDGAGGYCCLGVICVIYAREHLDQIEFVGGQKILANDGQKNLPVIRVVSVETHPLTGKPRLETNELMPPPSVIEYYKLGWGAEQQQRDLIGRLAGLNDHGWTFEQIADLIERHLDDRDNALLYEEASALLQIAVEQAPAPDSEDIEVSLDDFDVQQIGDRISISGQAHLPVQGEHNG